jgi:hypothetical protein
MSSSKIAFIICLVLALALRRSTALAEDQIAGIHDEGPAVSEQTVFSFPGPAFAEPSLAADASGNLYGSLQTVGPDGNFTNLIYKLSQAPGEAWSSETIYEGFDPDRALLSVVDAAGNLYGVTEFDFVNENNCGIVFQLTPTPQGAWNETNLQTFSCSGKNAADALGPLVADSSGNLYGAASSDGSNFFVYEMVRGPLNQWTYSVIYNCSSTDKCGNVLGPFDAEGNLYGAGGSVYQITPHPNGTWTHKTLHTLTPFTNVSALIFDSQGNLFGADPLGGNKGNGIVFELSPNGKGAWKFKTVFNFARSATEGAGPYGIFAPSPGNLVGTTAAGGASGDGTIFTLTLQPSGSWRESLIHGFKSSDGASPGVLLPATGGNLFGVAGGGINNCPFGGCGVVFEVTP